MHDIAQSQAMLSEARMKLPELKARALTPAGEVGVGRAIAARFQTFPQPLRNQVEWQAFWRDYTDALEDVPEGAIEAAMKAWVRAGTSQFLPKPGELRQLALTTENRDARAYERARKASEYQPPKVYETTEVPKVEPRIMRQEPTQAEKERVRRWASEYAAQVPSKTVAEPMANHGAVDDRGLTAAMREAMSRRNAGP